MNVIALIPARYQSTRFPAKLMQDLAGEPVIWRTYASVINTQLFDDVIVVTDHSIIYDAIIQRGGKAMYSDGIYECGTDRIAAAAVALPDADLIINIQGDEPFSQKEPLAMLIDAFKGEDGSQIQAASLVQIIKEQELIHNPNNVKVILDKNQFAIYFSRSPIPYKRAIDTPIPYYKHIGIYAFRRQMLIDFTKIPQGPLEQAEMLENLRFIENRIPIKMIICDYKNVGIDTPEDLEIARQFLQKTSAID